MKYYYNIKKSNSQQIEESPTYLQLKNGLTYWVASIKEATKFSHEEANSLVYTKLDEKIAKSC